MATDEDSTEHQKRVSTSYIVETWQGNFTALKIVLEKQTDVNKE